MKEQIKDLKSMKSKKTSQYEIISVSNFEALI